MKLQILIPQFSEGEKVIKPLLDSIQMQQSVDLEEIGVIICNDGSQNILSEEFLRQYSYGIQYFREPHRGVSGTRNACLDKASAEYVMFCDADDMFYNLCGLYILFKEMECGFDVLISEFVQETRTLTGEITFLSMERDSTFVHGKVFRREYLKQNHIRFCEKLLVHEDSYFVVLASRLAEKLRYCPSPFYLWRFRADSICRRDCRWIFKTYPQFIDSQDALVEQFLERDKQKLAMAYAVAAIFDAYYTMNKPEWIYQENKGYRERAEKRMRDFYLAHISLWDEMPEPERMNISNTVRQRNVKEGMGMENMTIEDWLQHLKAL